MPVPDFDQFGLLPDGVHSCTVEEVKNKLAWNAQRIRLTDLLWEFIAQELRPRFEIVPPIVLNGSYVTSENCPSDINLVLVLRDLPDNQQWEGQMLYQRNPDLLQRYQVDMRPGLERLNQDFVAYFKGLRPQIAFAKGLRYTHTKGLLRLE